MHGSHDHPNAVNFNFRLKKLLIAKDAALLFEKANTCADDFDCLSTGPYLMKTINKGLTCSERSSSQILHY